MSFPRAKIQRFNDVLNSVPSPTKYDPKLGDKVIGGCILKGETRSSNFSDTASASSSKSCQTPVFRTPQLPRRHNCLGTAEKMNVNAFKSISFKSEDIEFLHQDSELEELKALRVECYNKTETITDLEKHIQELKTRISDQEKAKAQLEVHISELEIAKSNLECIGDNERCEKIAALQTQLEVLENKVEELMKNREEYLTKVEESEKKNNKLEELNLDFERKIISLEGTIEQLELDTKNKEKMIAELRQKEIFKMKHQISIECLQGKISTLENEIKELDSSKSKNEATIFGLETEISSLNAQLEKLRNEKLEVENLAKELKVREGKMEEDCKTYSDTITGLEMELENRVKELQQFHDSNAALKTEMEALNIKLEEQKASFEQRLKNLFEKHEEELKDINEKYEIQKELLKTQQKDFETKSVELANSHAEEILKLQNDYESKLLAQMQENTEKINLLQCQLDERDATLKQANIKYKKIFAEWENKLQEAEINFSKLITKLESEHLGNLEEVEKTYSEKIKILEINSSKAIDLKNQEIDILTDQYKEILGEVKELLKDLEKKDFEIQKIAGSNTNLNSRVKLMLEEIKLLNRENEIKSENLKAMTKKYNEEFNKNEQLSCKLGELDCKIAQLKENLSRKVDECRKMSEDLRKFKSFCDKIQGEKSDLEANIIDLQEKMKKLMKELEENEASYEDKINRTNEELTLAKNQCRKFEIVMGNTRKSLEAVRERLIESENQVEKLNLEKSELIEKSLILTKKLTNVEEENRDLKKKNEDLMDTKSDLEAVLDEYISNNKELSEKCGNLESLCDEFEVKLKELSKLNEDLEIEKQNSIQALTDVIRKQELQLIDTERDALDQVEKVSQMLTEKLEFFMKFSTEKIQNLMSEVKSSKKESEVLKEALTSKTDDYDNLMTDYEILKTTVEIAVKESEGLKKKCQDQELELKKMKDSITELLSEKKKMDEVLEEKEGKYSRMVETCQKLTEEMECKVADLKKEKERREVMEKEITKIKYEIEERKISVEEKEEKIKECEKKILALEIKIREKDTDIALCQGEKLICIQEIQSLTAEKEQLLINVKIAHKSMETSDKLLEEFKEETRKVEEEREKFKMELENLSVEKSRLELELLAVKEENKKVKESATSLEEVEERKNYYKSNCIKLDKLCFELTQENTSLKSDFCEIHSLLQEKDRKVEELQKRCSELESLIGPFREQLEQYENERLLIENDREQLRKQHLEQAAKLGHQNHKQKIQHVVKLKNTLLETRKENEKLLLEVKNLKKKVQKLQEELGQDPKRLFIKGKRPASTPFKGKENTTLVTPSAGMITPVTISVKQEPVSPGSPLRNRNQ